jgi:hypothetical protein
MLCHKGMDKLYALFAEKEREIQFISLSLGERCRDFTFQK